MIRRELKQISRGCPVPGAILLCRVPLAEAVSRTGLSEAEIQASGAVFSEDGRVDLSVLAGELGAPVPAPAEILGRGTL